MSASEELEAVDPLADEEAPVGHPRRMLDRYEIIAEIARGGMGTVLLGRLAGAGGFERLMAIKLMHEHLAQDAAFVTMLLDEARTAANIHHPNAVGIVDVAESPLGYYLVMSYVEGFTLAELIDHPKLEPRDRIRLGLRLLIDACHGLHAAHTTRNARGEPLDIVHRDVSPQNVLVGLDGVGRIVDFGIALAASRVASSRPGVLKGKPSYMAPEQVKGTPCDARADVFALGTILWEILVGRRLFQAEVDIATLVMVMDSPIPVPSTIQPLSTAAIDAVAMQALERDRDARYRDARSLARELEAAAAEGGLLASTHDVADAVEALFAEQIAAKQEAIRHHLSSSTGEQKPLAPGQLGLVPKLYDRAPTPRSSQVPGSGVRERGIDAHAGTREGTPAPRGGAARTVALEAAPPEGGVGGEPAAGEATPDRAAAAVEPSTGRAPAKAGPPLGAIAGVVGALVAIGLGMAYLGGSDPDPIDAAPASAPRVSGSNDTTAVDEPTAEEVVAPAPSEALAPPADPTAAEPRAVEGQPAGAGPEGSRRAPGARDDPSPGAGAPSERATAPDRPRAHRDPSGRRDTTRDRPADPSEPRRPTLETNPYLTH